MKMAKTLVDSERCKGDGNGALWPQRNASKDSSRITVPLSLALFLRQALQVTSFNLAYNVRVC